MSPAVRGAIALSLFLAVPVLADDYDDFRIPDHRVSDWSTSLSARSDGSTIGTSSEYESRSRSGSLATGAFWLRDSDPARTSFSISGSSNARRNRRVEETDSEFATLDRATTSTLAQESWGLSAEHRWYPGRGAIGYTATAAGSGNYAQTWDQQSIFATQSSPGLRVVDIVKDRSSQWFYTTHASARLAAGAGRVRDATAVYDAQVLEQRLNAAGALARPLSDPGRRRLIGLLSVRYAHRAILDRPGTTLWREIAAILAEDGAVEGQVDPEAVLRAMEPHISQAASLPREGIPSSPVLRQVGWFAGIGVEAVHSHDRFRRDQSSYRESTINGALQPVVVFTGSDQRTSDYDQVGFGPLVEVHRPLGPRWQMGAASRAIFPAKDPANAFSVYSWASLYWLAADRWMADVRVTHQRESRSGGIFTPLERLDLWAVSYSASMRYYLQDDLELALTAAETQVSAYQYFVGWYAREGAVTLSLTYRLLGRIEAPNLMNPVRFGAF